MIYSNTVNKGVLEVFDRNKHWKNCLIATDVTGSMSPYMAQFLVWHTLNAKVSPSHKDFVFFNDGDNANDLTKKMGKVGGVYYMNKSSHKKVEKVLKEAKRKGGGDAPGNNVEATIKELKRNPSVQGVIMIADNQATPRDLELLRKVKKPIHVILCGASTKINIDYLNMAYATGGNLHTIEEDIKNLGSMANGKIIEVMGQKYKLTNGEFLYISLP